MNPRAQITLKCGCCGDSGFTADDMATPEDFGGAFMLTLQAFYRGNICAPCADDHVECANCKRPTLFDASIDHHGDRVCQDCASNDGGDCHSYAAQHAEARAAGHFS